MDRPGNARMLPFVVLRRAIQPYAFAVSLYTGLLALFILEDTTPSALLDGPIGEVIGMAAAVTTLLLWWGWWARSSKALEHGLLLSAAVIAAVAGTLFVDRGIGSASAWLAVPWVVASCGAWLLEVNDPDGGVESDR